MRIDDEGESESKEVSAALDALALHASELEQKERERVEQYAHLIKNLRLAAQREEVSWFAACDEADKLFRKDLQ